MRKANLPVTLQSGADGVLDESVSVSELATSGGRGGLDWRRRQDAFLDRARRAVERSERQGRGVSPQDLLEAMDGRLEAARGRLAASRPAARRGQ